MATRTVRPPRTRPTTGDFVRGCMRRLIPQPAVWDIYAIRRGGYFKAPAGLTQQDKADAAALDRLLTQLLDGRRAVFTAPGYWHNGSITARMAATCGISPGQAIASEIWHLRNPAYLHLFLGQHAPEGAPLILAASDPALDALTELAQLSTPSDMITTYPLLHFRFLRRHRQLHFVGYHPLLY